MRIRDLNRMQLDEYLKREDRIVLPVGAIEQHADLSLVARTNRGWRVYGLT